MILAQTQCASVHFQGAARKTGVQLGEKGPAGSGTEIVVDVTDLVSGTQIFVCLPLLPPGRIPWRLMC